MWGEGQIVLTGDEVRAVELWWTNSNEAVGTTRARRSLCIPLQFIEGAKLMDQKGEVLWGRGEDGTEGLPPGRD